MGLPEGTAIGKTTLAAALKATDTAVNLATLSITVGPYTTVTARNPQWGLKVDNEIMEITSIGASTTVYVNRGQGGTVAAAHANGQTVWAAPLANLPPISELLGPIAPARPLGGIATVPIGSVAYGSFGNNTTLVAGTLYAADCYVPNGFVATGIKALVGGTGGTDKWIAYLLDLAGNIVAQSTSAGITVSGSTNAFQAFAFANTCWVPGGEYFLCIQSNGTTATLRTVAASTFQEVLTTSITGTFATLPAWTIPTTFTANVGPIAFLY